MNTLKLKLRSVRFVALALLAFGSAVALCGCPPPGRASASPLDVHAAE